MWRPPSKHACLAIDREGIAIRLGKAPPITLALVSDLAKDVTHAHVPSNSRDHELSESTLLASLSPYQQDLHGASLRVVLSNCFFRFQLLPWQAGLDARSDWEAFARHALRQIHGPKEAEWALQLQFFGYGQRILVAAMDEKLLSTLKQLSRALRCQCISIAPLLGHALALHANAPQRQPQLLVAEPARALYMQGDAEGWQQIQMTTLPAIPNLDALKACLWRGQQQSQSQELDHHLLPVHGLISGTFQPIWETQALPHIQLLHPLHASTSHAAWLAGSV